MNQIIIDEFERLLAFIQNQNEVLKQNNEIKELNANKFRLKQLSRVLSILKKYPNKITKDNYTTLDEIDGIGKGTITRINEILETGKLKEIEGFIDINKKKQTTINELEEVVGIGHMNALNFYNMGITSVNMLKNKIKSKEIVVNDKILLGLKYHGKYHTNIPRSEMDLYYEFFKHLIKKINNTLKLNDSNKYVFEMCGSYRREKLYSNDIDILISKLDTHSDEKQMNHLKRFISKLKTNLRDNMDKPLLVDSMTDKKIKTKYMGFSKLYDNMIRRIDIRFVTYDSYYTALLYFTGSSELNQKMRHIAKTHEYKLNEYGLYDKNNNKININSERDVFKKLEMEYLPPRLR